MGPTDHPEEIQIAVSRGSNDALPFYCVSPMKLSLLSIASLGIYELVWFYKNWKLVKAGSALEIRPFWRAIFSPIFCHPFATAVDSAAESANVSERISPLPIAALYAVLIVLQELPDPYWLICFFSFVPLIPVARQIQRVHEAIHPGSDSEVGWNVSSCATLVIGSVLAAFVLVGTFGPPTRALRQAEIPASYQSTLVEAGVLEPQEQIQFFYSAGFFSILEDGNLLTNERVVSYETIDGELYVFSSPYPEIEKVGVDYSKSSWEDTVITVWPISGDEFLLLVSAEDEHDHEFVASLESRRLNSPQDQH